MFFHSTGLIFSKRPSYFLIWLLFHAPPPPLWLFLSVVLFIYFILGKGEGERTGMWHPNFPLKNKELLALTHSFELNLRECNSLTTSLHYSTPKNGPIVLAKCSMKWPTTFCPGIPISTKAHCKAAKLSRLQRPQWLLFCQLIRNTNSNSPPSIPFFVLRHRLPSPSTPSTWLVA